MKSRVRIEDVRSRQFRLVTDDRLGLVCQFSVGVPKGATDDTRKCRLLTYLVFIPIPCPVCRMLVGRNWSEWAMRYWTFGGSWTSARTNRYDISVGALCSRLIDHLSYALKIIWTAVYVSCVVPSPETGLSRDVPLCLRHVQTSHHIHYSSSTTDTLD